MRYNIKIEERYKKDRDRRKKFENKVVTLGNQKYFYWKFVLLLRKKNRYTDINKLKNLFKNILQKTSNDEIIKEPHHTMVNFN